MSAPAADEAALSAAATAATAAMAGSGPADALAGPLSAAHAPTAVAERCANCDAPLSGPYCSQCGQRHEHAVHSVSHFIGEAFEDLTHADSRLWRTLGALIFHPGFLTREFLDGRRARYLPPVRLYLVLSVAFFVIAGILTSHSRGSAVLVEVQPAAGTVASRRLEPATPAFAREQCAVVPRDLPWLGAYGPRFEAGCVAAMEDGGRSANESVLHNVPRAMFLFLPLLGLVMKALYRRPRRHYVEHLLFFVHNHALIFLVLTAYGLLGAILPPPVTSVPGTGLCIYVTLYFFASMLRVYGQGWLATAGKLAVLSFAYLVLGGLMLATLSLYAMLTL
ncbi:MAG: DUF3667 domain-containing protein [Steroidobacteraceae bacterium]